MPPQQNKGIEESTPTANWEVKYNSILQVLESRNDTTSKYKRL
jgi:hypothetical protein